MKIISNIDIVSKRIQERLKKLDDKEYLLRPVCFDIIELMTKRIHIDGRDSKNQQIGIYSKGYMALRTGKFKNADKFTKGKKKGFNKNSGKFTNKASKEKTGKDRPNYNRSSDPKVVISLTRKLENDWSVIATKRGYGIGFLNPDNFKKARWTENTYQKKIFSLTPEERDYAVKKIQDLIKKSLE